MPDIEMRCVANNGDGNRNVVTFEPVYQENEEQNATGSMTISVTNTDEDTNAGEDFEVGKIYVVSLRDAGPRRAANDPAALAASMAAQAAAIPNSTNTRHYKTPPEQKVPPPVVPDGVVTLPRPSVVLEPLTSTPPDAGVVSGPANNPSPQPGTAGASVSTPTESTPTTRRGG